MRASPRRFPSICVFLFALVVGQALGLVHGIAHMHAHAGSPALSHGAEMRHASGAGEHWTRALFGSHAAGSADCLVAGHGLSPDLHALPVVSLPQPAPTAMVAAVAVAASSVAGGTWFSARAPPVFG